MPAYKDKRDGTWRYRKWVKLPNGTSTRITGTPSIDTKAAAEHAEHMHIDRLMHPERAQLTAPTAPHRKEMPTVKDFSERFTKEYRPKDQKPTERYAKKNILASHLVPFFGPVRLDEIGQGHLDAFVAKQTVSNKTINNRLSVLSTMPRYAHELGIIPEPKLRFHIKATSADVPAVPMADVRKLVASASLVYQAAVLLAAEAGLRIGEIRGLQWSDVKTTHIEVRRSIDQAGNVGAPKNAKARKVSLSPTVQAQLAMLPKRALWVLCTDEGQPLRYEVMLETIGTIYTAAGVTVPASETGATLPWHSLRHTFGTELAARGVPLPVIKELMGHADIKTTMRYVTVTGSQLDAAIALTFGQPVGNAPAEASEST